MRAVLTILGLMYISAGFSQTGKDTLFLKKEKFGTVYITSDTSIIEYKWLNLPDLNEKNYAFYKEYYNDLLKDTVIKIKHFNLGQLPKKWSPLFMIKDKHYVYAPSDWMFNFGFALNDSVVSRLYTDGPDVMIILDFKQKSHLAIKSDIK